MKCSNNEVRKWFGFLQSHDNFSKRQGALVRPVLDAFRLKSMKGHSLEWHIFKAII